MVRASYYSRGARPAGITLVRYSTHCFFDLSQNDQTRSTDVGASQLIIDGKIKLKNDAQIARFTQTGLEFSDGSALDADAVVFATG
jgi:hypothetical protein